MKYIPRIMHIKLWYVLLLLNNEWFFPNPSGLLHFCFGNYNIAPNSWEVTLMNMCKIRYIDPKGNVNITTMKQSKTKPYAYLLTSCYPGNCYKKTKSYIQKINMTDMNLNIAGNFRISIVIIFTCVFGSLFQHIINILILNSISSWVEDFQMTGFLSTIDMVPALHLSILTEPRPGLMVRWWFELCTVLKRCWVLNLKVTILREHIKTYCTYHCFMSKQWLMIHT